MKLHTRTYWAAAGGNWAQHSWLLAVVQTGQPAWREREKHGVGFGKKEKIKDSLLRFYCGTVESRKCFILFLHFSIRQLGGEIIIPWPPVTAQDSLVETRTDPTRRRQQWSEPGDNRCPLWHCGLIHPSDAGHGEVSVSLQQ